LSPAVGRPGRLSGRCCARPWGGGGGGGGGEGGGARRPPAGAPRPPRPCAGRGGRGGGAGRRGGARADGGTLRRGWLGRRAAPHGGLVDPVDEVVADVAHLLPLEAQVVLERGAEVLDVVHAEVLHASDHALGDLLRLVVLRHVLLEVGRRAAVGPHLKHRPHL